MFPSEILNVDDPVLMYDRFMEEIDLKKVPSLHTDAWRWQTQV